jgi:hypothetical protein
MSDTAVRIHLERLVAMEYVRPAAGRNGQRFEYELLFDGELGASAPQMIGLIDVAALHAAALSSVDTTATSQGAAPDLAPRLQAARTELAPALPGAKSAATASAASASSVVPSSSAENALLRPAARGGRSASRARSTDPSFLAASSVLGG